MKKLYFEMGQRLGQLRKERKLTQQELSELLEVNPKHVSRVERGLSSYSLEKLLQAAEVLNCSIDYLFFGTKADTLLSILPPGIMDILNSSNEREINLLKEYISMYDRLRRP